MNPLKILNSLSKVLIIVIALVITILISRIVPEKQFEPYTLELDSVWNKIEGDQQYVVDLSNDLLPEFITHHNINQSGHSLEYRFLNNLYTVHIFYKDDFFISKHLHFSDINQDGKKEIIFITAIDKIAWLNIFSYNSYLKQYRPEKKVKIGPVKYYNNKPDVINYTIISNQTSVYFDLTPGYSVVNRYIYKYNFANDCLEKTDKNSFVIKKIGLLNFGGKDYLLAREMQATGNTMTTNEYQSMEKSKNTDTISMFKTYKPLKHLVYDYGDFSSYILLYTDGLDFAFKPIEFIGWTNYTKSELMNIQGIPHIIALTNTIKGDTINKVITLCDLKGNIVKQLPLPCNYTEIYTGNSRIVFKNSGTLFIYSNQLEMINQISEITHSSGFFDISEDQKSEFIAFRNDKMIVFSPEFDVLATYKISQEFAPYPEANGISLLQIGYRQGFVFNTRLFYYLFSYSKNPLAIFKYPFYFLVFFFWFGLLAIILKLHSKRLENENLRLEKVVSERTLELQSKNNELAAKNEEIQTQAEKITEQYEHLEKLDQFKESLTHALVHDLKNPLNQIMLKTSNPLVTQSAGKMLQLIMNMLDVEKYEHAKFELNKDVHCLSSIIDEVKKGQEITMNEKNLELKNHFGDYHVLVDKAILVRIFDNLLSNAIRYSTLNQVIDIFAEPTADHFLKISIRNYGESISQEILPYIFDKYRQFGKNEGRTYRTTGLGLTFCKMAVEAHGGKIGVRSNTEEGTNFWLTIPFTVIEAENVEIQNTEYNNQPKIQLSVSDRELLKSAVKLMKEFEIYEISRFHEVLDPFKETSGSNVNEWISLLYGAIYVQNKDLFDRLIMLAENEQTKNTDR